MNDEKRAERELLLEELRFSKSLLGLGKQTGAEYCFPFNDDGFDGSGNRFSSATAIPQIAELATDEQLLTYFSGQIMRGTAFKGEYYTIRDGALSEETEWPAIRDNLWALREKHPVGNVEAVLEACYVLCVKKEICYKNYLYIQAAARDLGVGNFMAVLTDLELAEIVIRHKGDIRIPPERVPLVEEFLCESKKQAEQADEDQEKPVEIPDNLFGDIIGHDEVKELLTACLKAERPVHVLLSGPPALAKSLFLWDIERIAGERALWLVGSATSKAGLWDVIAEKQPQILLIDEFDKMNASDTAALLSIMEGGRLVRAKKGRELDISNPLRVVAACNRLNNLSPELKSRFAVRKIESYSHQEFLAVVQGVLVDRENLDEKEAEEIARHLDGHTQNVRDAIRVARLVPQLGVKKALRLLMEQDG